MSVQPASAPRVLGGVGFSFRLPRRESEGEITVKYTDTLRGPIPTFWDGDGVDDAIRKSAGLIPKLLGVPAVQLHTWDSGPVLDLVRRSFPGADLIVGFGMDEIAREVAKANRSIVWGVSQFRLLGDRASSWGARMMVANAEGSWKTQPNTVQRSRLARVVTQGLAAVRADHPDLALAHTAYDHPGFHTTYNWEDWLGTASPVECSFPQVYAAPGGEGLMAHRGALPAREARAIASWNAMIRAGRIAPDAPDSDADVRDVNWRPYYQLHSVPTADTVESALKHECAAFWALQSRSDMAGQNALCALVELYRRGLWHPGGARELQTAVGVKVDGRIGDITARAAKIPGWQFSSF